MNQEVGGRRSDTVPGSPWRGEEAVQRLERGNPGVGVEEALRGRHSDVGSQFLRREGAEQVLQRVVVAALGGSEANEGRLIPPCLQELVAPLRSPHEEDACEENPIGM